MAFGATHPSEEPVMRDDSVGLDLDFEDWREALGLWMAELEGDDPSWLTFNQWEGLYRGLAGEMPVVDSSGSSMGPLIRAYSRGLLTRTELVTGLIARPGLWNQLWSGAAAHRAGADWIGHLLAAALRGCPPLLDTPLPLYFLTLRDERLLSERVWRHREGDVPSEYGDSSRLRRELAEQRLLDGGWDGTTEVKIHSPEVDPWVDPLVWGLGWIGWMGNTIIGDALPDAAWQAAVHGNMPLVARLDGFVNYFVLDPTFVSGHEVSATDLLSGRPYSLRPSPGSTSGWSIEARGWTSRN